MARKGQVEWDTIVPWVIGIFVLVLVLVLFFTLRGKGSGALTFLRNLFRFG